MPPSAVKAKLRHIQPLRALFLQETNFQIRYNACHERGWTDSYLLKIDDATVGYGSIKGREIADRDTAFEFYVVPPFRKLSSLLFRELIATYSPWESIARVLDVSLRSVDAEPRDLIPRVAHALADALSVRFFDHV